MDNSQSTVCFEDCPISCTVLPGATTALYLWLWSVGRGGCERPHRWCHCPPVQESGIEAWLRVGSTCGQVLGGLPKHLADSCRTLTLCVFCNTHTHTHTHTHTNTQVTMYHSRLFPWKYRLLPFLWEHITSCTYSPYSGKRPCPRFRGFLPSIYYPTTSCESKDMYPGY